MSGFMKLKPALHFLVLRGAGEACQPRSGLQCSVLGACTPRRLRGQERRARRRPASCVCPREG